jgi:hypothetical protein
MESRAIVRAYYRGNTCPVGQVRESTFVSITPGVLRRPENAIIIGKIEIRLE